MPFEFLFKDLDDHNWGELHQGDILQRTDALGAVIAEAHGYYASEPSYTHFMVLTQSCDLVRRNGKQKARYITLAAVRPLSALVDIIISKYKCSPSDVPIVICRAEAAIYARQVLEKLVHNTYDGYFFIPKDSHSRITEDMLAFLPLSIALRVTHFDECLRAKVAELRDIFEAKVGWLTGNLYSRVGTPDIEEVDGAEDIKKQFYDDALFGRTVWLSAAQNRAFTKSLQAWRRSNDGAQVPPDVAIALAREVPRDLDLIAQRAVEELARRGILPNDPAAKERAVTVLVNDKGLERLIRGYANV